MRFHGAIKEYFEFPRIPSASWGSFNVNQTLWKYQPDDWFRDYKGISGFCHFGKGEFKLNINDDRNQLAKYFKSILMFPHSRIVGLGKGLKQMSNFV